MNLSVQDEGSILPDPCKVIKLSNTVPNFFSPLKCSLSKKYAESEKHLTFAPVGKID
nr:hypothetical protein Iba_chr10cCG4040 [Ipomoea batatas]